AALPAPIVSDGRVSLRDREPAARADTIHRTPASARHSSASGQSVAQPPSNRERLQTVSPPRPAGTRRCLPQCNGYALPKFSVLPVVVVHCWTQKTQMTQHTQSTQSTQKTYDIHETQRSVEAGNRRVSNNV